MEHKEKLAYKKAIRDCMHILLNLYEVYGDYSEVEEVYFQYRDEVKKLLKEKGFRV